MGKMKKTEKLRTLEKELFVEIIKECAEERGDDSLSPDTLGEKMYDKYTRASEAGTWLMSQEAAYAVVDLVEDENEPTPFAELLALDNEKFIEAIEDAALESVMNATEVD